MHRVLPRIYHMLGAGRLQIINAMLFSTYNFWGAVFILTQSVLKAVGMKCDYVWGSTEKRRNMALVTWDKICVPKMSNVSSVGKLVKLLWQLTTKKDVLWVKWMTTVYMKASGDIWNHTPPQDCSWYWKKLNSLKEMMLN